MLKILEKLSNLLGFSEMKEQANSEAAKKIASNIKRIEYDRSTNTASLRDIKDD